MVKTEAYELSRRFLSMFLMVIEKNNKQIFTYLKTGWNVPVDCTELAGYIQESRIEDFIEGYNSVLSHVDEIVEKQAGLI